MTFTKKKLGKLINKKKISLRRKKKRKNIKKKNNKSRKLNKGHKELHNRSLKKQKGGANEKECEIDGSVKFTGGSIFSRLLTGGGKKSINVKGNIPNVANINGTIEVDGENDIDIKKILLTKDDSIVNTENNNSIPVIGSINDENDKQIKGIINITPALANFDKLELVNSAEEEKQQDGADQSETEEKQTEGTDQPEGANQPDHP